MVARGFFADGDTIVLLDRRGRRYLKRLKGGQQITIRGSVIAVDSLIGRPEGTWTSSCEPERFLVFRATYAELVVNLKRPAEPIFPKDAAFLLLRADIHRDDTIVEIGTGAGALTLLLLRSLDAQGRLVSYELRADFAAVSKRNVELYHGPAPRWQLKIRDARAGLDETLVDRVIVDVPEPASLVDVVAQALRPGGMLAAYVPSVPQFQELHRCLTSRSGFADVCTYEILERAWHVEGRSVRPEQSMIGHTGFLTFARRLGG